MLRPFKAPWFSKTGYQSYLSGLPGIFRSAFQPVSIGNDDCGHKVAWLEGLRGFVTMLVYMEHHVGFAHQNVWSIQRAYGWRDEYYAICLPGIRIFFSGGYFAVSVFFAISGYVLSIYPLALLYSGNSNRLCAHIGAAIPRRWVRLFVPVACTTFLFLTSWHILDIQTSNPTSDPPEPTYLKEVAKWIGDFKSGTFFFKNEPFYRDIYNPHIWSIAAEFRGSVIIYISMLVSLTFIGHGHGVRLLSEISLTFYFLFLVNGWYLALFTVGMLLCDLDMLSEHDMMPEIPVSKSITRFKSQLERGFGWTMHALLALSIYLAGVPHTDDRQALRDKDPGWYTLATLAPSSVEPVRWYFLFWAATLAMFCIPRIRWLRAIFDSAPCQYLGKISFGIYLIHGPILWTVGDRLYAAVGRPRTTAADMIPQWMNILPLPDIGPLGLEINAIVPQIVLLPLTLWLAGVVTVLFDKPSVKLGRWLFEPCPQGSSKSIEP